MITITIFMIVMITLKEIVMVGTRNKESVTTIVMVMK